MFKNICEWLTSSLLGAWKEACHWWKLLDWFLVEEEGDQMGAEVSGWGVGGCWSPPLYWSLSNNFLFLTGLTWRGHKCSVSLMCHCWRDESTLNHVWSSLVLTFNWSKSEQEILTRLCPMVTMALLHRDMTHQWPELRWCGAVSVTTQWSPLQWSALQHQQQCRTWGGGLARDSRHIRQQNYHWRHAYQIHIMTHHLTLTQPLSVTVFYSVHQHNLLLSLPWKNYSKLFHINSQEEVTQ